MTPCTIIRTKYEFLVPRESAEEFGHLPQLGWLAAFFKEAEKMPDHVVEPFLDALGFVKASMLESGFSGTAEDLFKYTFFETSPCPCPKAGCGSILCSLTFGFTKDALDELAPPKRATSFH